MSGKWSTSTRRTELPPNWQQLRRDRKRLARGRCEAERHAAKCNGYGTDLDHHLDRDDHRLEALRWLSSPCHDAKTQREAAAARPQRRRDVELTPAEQLARALTSAGRVGEGPHPKAPGTGGDSSSLPIQVPSSQPTPEPAPADPRGAPGRCPRCGWHLKIDGHAPWCPARGVGE